MKTIATTIITICIASITMAQEAITEKMLNATWQVEVMTMDFNTQQGTSSQHECVLHFDKENNRLYWQNSEKINWVEMNYIGNYQCLVNKVGAKPQKINLTHKPISFEVFNEAENKIAKYTLTIK